MKINKKALTIAATLIIVLPILLMAFPKTEASTAMPKWLKVKEEPNFRGVWYKFETPNITLLFPAKGTKPMFIWWYTNKPEEVYVIKFKGVIEYLAFDKPYYVRRFRADNLTIRDRLMEKFVWPKITHHEVRNMIMNRFAGFTAKIFDLHPPLLPFSGCKWKLDPPKLVETENAAYYSFNFTLVEAPMPKFDFAEGNIQIRCRFYLTNTTETPDMNYPEYNYTVAAGQLKFDFVVSNWEWNIDKLKPFFDWLREEFDIKIPPHKTGLALWINMASIKIEELPSENEPPEAQSQFMEQIESKSHMEGAFIDNEYCKVISNETQKGIDEKPIATLLQLKERFRHRVRIHFAHGRKDVPVGFLEFVPWARLLNETGNTVDFVNVTASYIAAGHHLRLFICYPYFGNYTLEHDPTIGLASAPQLPTLLTPEVIGALLLTTVIITIAILAYKRRKETINIISP